PGERGHLTSPWALGVTADDSDDLFGFGPGPEIPGKDAIVHPHLGWLVLACSPTVTASQKWNVRYSDGKVYSKAFLIDGLKKKYGTIAARNAAWGSKSSTFGSDGGWGVGAGLEDEDGRHTAWLGSRDGDLDHARPAVVRDLDD